ncbi:hypothetical protein Unana1_08334 [Umbelopsis nana]
MKKLLQVIASLAIGKNQPNILTDLVLKMKVFNFAVALMVVAMSASTLAKPVSANNELKVGDFVKFDEIDHTKFHED